MLWCETCRGSGGRGEWQAGRSGPRGTWEEAVAANTRAPADTFPKLLLRNASSFGDRPAMRHKDLGIWQTWTWTQVRDQVLALAAGLHRLGLKRGDTIAIVGSNRPKLYWSVAAAQVLGAIPVPVYADAVADELAFVLAHAEVRFATVEDQEQVDKILSVSERLPKLEKMVYDEPRGLREYDHANLHPVDQVIAGGREALKDPALAKWLDGEIAAGKGSDTSIILYTSGTTGQSKGVVLSAERCIAAGSDTVAFDKLTEKDEALAYLPLAWVGDHYLNYAQGMVAGFCMACCETSDTSMADLREIGPTFFFAPPRTFEQMLTRLMIRMEDAGFVKRKLFHYFIGVARQHGEAILNRQPVPLHGRLLYGLGDILVYGPLKNVLGLTNVRTAYTAGEAIGPDLFSFYRSLGLNLKQLYGQTEAFLYLTAQPDGQIYSDTVGPAMPNVDLRIADNGEVLFKSPGQFISYFKDEAKTKEAMTSDGYVKTGDAGFFDSKTGHLKIIDRAKDVGKLKDGTLFPPKYIENKLKFFPNIREAVAYGDGRDCVAVMINIDLTAVGSWAERNNVIYGSYQELAGHPLVYGMIQKNIEETNRSLAEDPVTAGAQVKRFLILHKELDADDGEVTRTQKVRRGFVAERYAPLIDALYDGSKEADISTQVTFEDGRKGTLSARVKVRDAATVPVAPSLGKAA
ncbi:MAG: AMP-binding protein [Xanthobacteraceae bacterium]|nr:AMP-binding protein [Xanthobacteraceae bacterium]